jgi:hypothetical protein
VLGLGVPQAWAVLGAIPPRTMFGGFFGPIVRQGGWFNYYVGIVHPFGKKK